MSADKANLDTHKTVETWQDELRLVAHSEKIPDLMRFFKTGRGEYGEGDIFIGIYVPDNRRISKGYAVLSLCEIGRMLDSPVHEFRLAGFLALVEKYRKSPQSYKGEIADFYFANCHKANNWDLVDLVAPKILGDRVLRFPDDRKILYDLAERHGQLWHQRVAVVSTWTLIREHRYDEALNICTLYLDHPHDLIHKASGWMLREIGKRGGMRHLMDFLDAHAHRMPRTMLRYAIEKLSAEQRQYYLHYSGT